MPSRPGRILSGIEYVTDTGAIIAMALAMLVVCAEVFFRYFLNSPLVWAHDVLVLYILPALFFLGLPGSYARGAHVSVDIICNYIGARPQLWLHVLARMVAIGVFFALFHYGCSRFTATWESGEILPGPVANWPIWPSTILVPIGAGLALLRAAERFIAEALALFGSDQEVEAIMALETNKEGSVE
jgi:TRAP-type C4-dicarboxylate transport system permease small subunit